MDEKSESAMLERIEKYRNEFHITNRRRIRAGIRCLLIVPLIFLILLLMTGSDRIIFLVLWVISMFLIAGYLIYLEYMDFKVDKMAADEAREQKTLSEREQKIYNMICENLHLSVEQVMAELDISRATVFRDYAKIKKVTGAMYDKKTSTWTL